jgi:hypothetical protein
VFVRSVGSADFQVVEESGRPKVASVEPFLTCFERKRGTEEGLANAGGTDKDDVSLFLEPPAGSERIQERTIQLSHSAVVEFFQTRVLADACSLDAGGKPPFMAVFVLGVQEQFKTFLEAKVPACRTCELLFERPHHALQSEFFKVIDGQLSHG